MTRRHLIWPGILIALIGSLVIVDLTMVVVASSDSTVRIVKPSDGSDSEPVISSSNGPWNISVQLGIPSETTVPVRVTVNDKMKRAVENASVIVRATPQSSNGSGVAAVEFPTREFDDGLYIAHVSVNERGMHNLQVDVQHNGLDQQYAVNRVLGTTQPVPIHDRERR